MDHRRWWGVAIRTQPETRMADRPPKILICSCEDTMPLDKSAVERGCRGANVLTTRQLCRAELEKFRTAADRVSGGAGRDPLGEGLSRRVRAHRRWLRSAGAVVTGHVELRCAP